MYKIYDAIDLTFNATVEGNPFKEVDFWATVEGDDYKKEIHGFYNGDNEFVLRLSFGVHGEYTYITHSNVKALDGQKGTVTVSEVEKTEKHGGVVLSDKNKNHLFYQDGTHYNLAGFECDWIFALSYDDKVEMNKTKQLIKEIGEQGFNHLVMNVYAYDLQWERDEWEEDVTFKPEHCYHRRKDIFPFLGNNENPDYTLLNIEFFKHLDNIIRLLDEANIVSHLMIYVWNKKVNWPEAYSEADNMYFDYVVKRYQAFSNIFWDISKEALGYGHDDVQYIVNRIKRLREMDAYNRLVTVHDFDFCRQYPELVDVISTQTWVYNLYNEMKSIQEKFPNKVIFNIEHGGYEESDYQIFTGNYTSPEVCLKRCYEIKFTDAYFCHYWQALSWSVMMLPSESQLRPKFEYYKYMIDFFDRYEVERLRQDEQIADGGYGMLRDDKSLALVYIPQEVYAITMRRTDLLSGRKVKYRYFNTLTGEYTEEIERQLIFHNQFISPFDVDSILVVEVIGE